MNDLVTWLRAQLDEDERLATAVSGHEVFDGTGIVIQRGGPASAQRSVVMPSHVATHISRHDPARVLAEVEAKRRILDDCADYDDVPGVTDGLSVRVPMLLALPYADRPGYREEWRP